MSKDYIGNKQLVTINTEKVYDWIVTETNFDLTLVNEPLPAGLGIGDFDPDEVTVEVDSAAVDPVQILSREERTFVVGNTEMELHVINLRKNLVATLLFPTAVGVEELVIPFARNEQIVLYAPEDTAIDLMYTEVDSFVATFDVDPGDTIIGPTFDAVINVRVCQSIQSTYPVTLEVIADYSQPRDLLPVQPCPPPTRPPQNPDIFPVVTPLTTRTRTASEPAQRRATTQDE